MNEAGAGAPAGAEGNARQLAAATLAFFLCFYAWSLLGPLGPDLQTHLGLSDFQLSVTVAVPVLLGSIMRVPLGMLTDRYGARRVFGVLMIWTLAPLIALSLWHDSFGAVLALGLLLGFAGASFAVGVPFVSRWYPPRRQGFALGIYGIGTGGAVLAGLTAPAIADEWGLAAPFLIAAGLVAAVAIGFLVVARNPPVPRPTASSMLAPLRVFRTSSRAWALTLFYFLSFGGFVAMFLYLPKLLTGVYDLDGGGQRRDRGLRARVRAARGRRGRLPRRARRPYEAP